jgi:alpha-L-fucosidase
MKINNEAIYATNSTKKYKEGEVKYTVSKDGKFVYAIVTKAISGELVLHNVDLKRGSNIYMLGANKPLKYKADASGSLHIEWPKDLPCKYAWTLKITGSPK